MKSGNQIILLRPDDHGSGPDTSWIEQLAHNLKLASDRYGADLSGIRLLSAKEKDAGQFLQSAPAIILIYHESYLGDAGFVKLVEKELFRKGDTRKVIMITASPPHREAFGGRGMGLASFGLFGPDGIFNESSPSYWSVLLDIVQDLGNEGPADRGIIYLAHTEPDILEIYHALRRELKARGFRIVPGAEFSAHPKELKALVQKDIEGARLAIHLLGDEYGKPVGEGSVSISELQVRVIGEYLKDLEKDDALSVQTSIDRLIWVDPDFNPKDKRQADFVEELKRNIEKLHRTEIIQNPLELFKTLVVKKLKEEDTLEQEEGKTIHGKGSGVYIIHQKSDEKAVVGLADDLTSKGLVISRLDYSGAHESLLREHKLYLRNCDASLIYYGNANRPWLRSKIMDLLKSPGYGRNKPLVLKQILTTGEDRLDDFIYPGGFEVDRETDPGKTVAVLLKQLK